MKIKRFNEKLEEENEDDELSMKDFKVQELGSDISIGIEVNILGTIVSFTAHYNIEGKYTNWDLNYPGDIPENIYDFIYEHSEEIAEIFKEKIREYLYPE